MKTTIFKIIVLAAALAFAAQGAVYASGLGSYNGNVSEDDGEMSIYMNVDGDSLVYGFNLQKIQQQAPQDGVEAYSIETEDFIYEFPFDMTNNVAGLNDYIKANRLKYPELELRVRFRRLHSNELDFAEASYQKQFPGGEPIGYFYSIDCELYNVSGTKLDFDAGSFNTPVKCRLRSEQAANAALYLNERGTFSYVPYKDGVLSLRHNGVYVLGANNISFADCGGHWAEEFIKNAANKGLVSGYDDGSFKPERPVTRAEFIQLMTNAVYVKPEGELPYNDVTKGNWYYDAVLRAYKAGWLDKLAGGGTFSPNQSITREEMLGVMDAAIADSGAIIPMTMELIDFSAIFSDYSEMDEKYESDLHLIYKTRIMQGVSADTFDPKGKTTRAQAAAVLNKLIEVIYR